MGPALGSTYYTIALRNTGSVSCTLQGYPGVSLVGGSNGEQIGAAAARTPGATKSVALATDASTTFSVQIATASNYPTSTCKPSPARGLRIYPPNSKQALFLARTDLTGCTATSFVLMHVGPIGVDPR